MQLLTTREAAAMLRLCPQSVRTLCDERKLVCIRHKARGKRLIPRESVEKYLAGLSDSVETYAPVTVQFDDVEKRLGERIKRLRKAR